MPRIYGVTTETGPGSSGGSSGGISGATFVLRGNTQNGSSVFLTTGGTGSAENSDNMLVVKPNTSVGISFHIVARTGAIPSKTATWNIYALATRDTSTSSVVFIGVSSATVISDPELSGLQINFFENNITGGISIMCTGVPQYTLIKWVATATLTEV